MSDKYVIPKEIDDRIPEYFYYAMAGELVSIFGSYILEEQDGYYDLYSGTGGWNEAFKATCRKLNMMWLDDYTKTLRWDEGDLFDGEIETEIINRFCKKDHYADHANCYYKYLCEIKE